jgi:hypothetical protein
VPTILMRADVVGWELAVPTGIDGGAPYLITHSTSTPPSLCRKEPMAVRSA